MAQKIPLIPVVLALAFLAFTVRLVEVASGIQDISGRAFAESEAPSEEVLEEPGDITAENDMPSDEDLVISNEPAPVADVDIPEWVDPSDADMESAALKMELLEDITQRRQQLDAREKELMTREALLKATEREMDRKFQELKQLRAEIEKLLTQQSEEERARIESLVKVYEAMKAKDAARIFDTLDLDILVAVMSEMSERRISPILAEMNPERARTVTIMLAEQKKLPSLPQN